MKLTIILRSVLCAGLLIATASAQQIQINKDNKTIAITTTGQADALADTAVISVGFQSFGKDKDSTYTMRP